MSAISKADYDALEQKAKEYCLSLKKLCANYGFQTYWTPYSFYERQVLYSLDEKYQIGYVKYEEKMQEFGLQLDVKSIIYRGLFVFSIELLRLQRDIDKAFELVKKLNEIQYEDRIKAFRDL